MRVPVVHGKIARRLLVNFRADPAVVQRVLPAPFRPRLHEGFAIAGICLIRLEQIRPVGLPALVGISSENAAHRIAVEWTDVGGMCREGVFISRRDTNSALNRLAGGRVFPGEHHGARFSVADVAGRIEFSLLSLDGEVSVRVIGHEAQALPPTSCFRSVAESSAFFESGSLGYSVTRSGRRFDGLTLKTMEWRARAMEIKEVASSFFDDANRFPRGSIEFDHALVMRDIAHEWHRAEDMLTRA